MAFKHKSLNLSAWVVDSSGRRRPEFKRRRIAPDTIESWIPSTEGERFGIYFKSGNQTLEQQGLDIHAVAELDGRFKLDGVILPSALRAQGKFGAILNQPVGNGEACPLKWGRLRLGGDKNSDNSNHTNTIQVRLEWGNFRELGTLNRFNKPKNREIVHESAVKDGNLASITLGRKANSSIARLCRFESDDRFKPQIFIFRYASREWLENHTQSLSFSEPSQPHLNPGDSRAGGMNNPLSTFNTPEGKSEQLEQDRNDQPTVAQIKVPNVSLRPTPSTHHASGYHWNKRPKNYKNSKCLGVSPKLKLEDDNKDPVLQSIHTAQRNGNSPEEPIMVNSESESDESSDDGIELIKCVTYYTKEKKRKRNLDDFKKEIAKKRLKSEEYTGLVPDAKSSGFKPDNTIDVKMECTD